MAQPTATSFLALLPGADSIPRPEPHQLMVLPRAAVEVTNEERAEVHAARRDAFESALDRAEAAFTGHDPSDVAVCLLWMAAQTDALDVNRVGWGPASELGWTLVASPRAEGPAAQREPLEAVWSVYDQLKVAVMASEPASAPASDLAAESHDSFFGFSRMVRNVRFDDQEQATFLSLWGTQPGAPDLCRLLTGLSAAELVDMVDAAARLTAGRAESAGLPRSGGLPLKRGDAIDVVFTSEELAAATGLPATSVEHALGLVSTAMGSARRPAFHEDTDLVRRYPILRLASNRWLHLGRPMMLRALLPRLEELAQPDGRRRERYARRRASWLEAKSLDVLSNFLRPDARFAGVEYSGGELDGLLVLDGTALLLEAKAGAPRASKRPHDAGRFDTDVRDLVLSAIAQLHKGRQALRSGAALRTAGASLEAPVAAEARMLGLVVTLNSLAPLTSSLWRLQASGRLTRSEALPWSLNVAHLESVCELLEFPAQLVHFLLRRGSVDRRVSGGDEIDWIMAYLRWELDFSAALDPDVGQLALPNGDDLLNPWVSYRRGWSDQRAPRPQQHFPSEIRQAVRRELRRLNESSPSGWLDTSLALLDRAYASTAWTARHRPAS